MKGIVFLFEVFGTIIYWLVLLAIIAVIILYFVDKKRFNKYVEPFFMKWISHFKDNVFSKHDNPSVDSMSAARSQRRKPNPKINEETSDEKLRQAQMLIRRLEGQLRDKQEELEKKDAEISYLEGQLSSARNEIVAIKQQQRLERPFLNTAEEVCDERQSYMLLYAYTPTSVSPYGFSKVDWQKSDDGQVFTMAQVSDSKASFALNKNCPNTRVLESLAYYDRLIEYEDCTNGNNATKIEMQKEGELRLIGEVWTIERKIKIKLL